MSWTKRVFWILSYIITYFYRSFLIKGSGYCQEDEVLCNEISDDETEIDIECISASSVCDGKFDCDNFRDEKYCFLCTESSQHSKNFPCTFFYDKNDTSDQDRQPVECVSQEKWCDGIPDCTHGSDELHCMLRWFLRYWNSI